MSEKPEQGNEHENTFPQNSGNSRKLVGPLELLKQSWQAYLQNITNFIGILIIALIGLAILGGVSMVVFAGGWALFPSNGVDMMGGAELLYFVISAVILFVICVIIYVWAYVAILQAIKDRGGSMSMLESYKRSWPLILPIIWLSILTVFVTAGGYLLFIIPGIILAVWFSFAPFVLIVENTRGFSALSKSREYVRGYWWAVFGRIIVLWIVGMVISILFSIALDLIPTSSLVMEALLTVIQQAVIALITPFFILYTYLLYEDAKAIKGNVPNQASKKQKIIYSLLGVFSIVVMIGGLLLSLFILAAFPVISQQELSPNMMSYPTVPVSL